METLTDVQLTAEEIGLKEILQTKVYDKIHRNSIDIEKAMTKIEEEGVLLNDYVVPVERIRFVHNKIIGAEAPGDIESGNVELGGINNDLLCFNQFSAGQLAEKMGVPMAYLKFLMFGMYWQKGLAVEILNAHAENISRERVLVREIQGIVRGFLSDHYKRLNSKEIYLSFLNAVAGTDMKLVSAYSGETKGYLEVIDPNIVSIPTEKNGIVHIVYGAQLRNSDFGAGALEMRAFKMQAHCLNGWVSESILREIHLGKRLPENLVLSEETYKYDTLTKANIVKDAMKVLVNPENRLVEANQIQQSGKVLVDVDREIKQLPKIGMHEGEIKSFHEVMLRNNPEDGVLGEPTLWKMAQAVGVVARDIENEDRKRDLQVIAGKIINRAPKIQDIMS